MKNKKLTRKEVYHSMVEVEKDLFPMSYKKKLEEKKTEESGHFGSELARKILEEIKRELKTA